MSERSETKLQNALELLAFRVSNEEYCIEIMKVHEIRGWGKPTPLPHAPKFVQGVINLRGTVLPILDLASRLGLPPNDPSQRDVIIVASHENKDFGLLVNAVSDIIQVEEELLQLPPDVSGNKDREYLKSLCIQGDRLIRILDLSNILLSDFNEAA